MSNWEARTLTTQQIKYAALDALLTGKSFEVSGCGTLPLLPVQGQAPFSLLHVFFHFSLFHLF